jgi:phosphatidylglycerophosphatase A
MDISRVAATFLGAGLFPVAPGTFASLLAALVHAFLLVRLPLAGRIAVVAGTFLLGVAASSTAARSFGLRDPRPVVIDEVAGQWTALLLAPAAWIPVLLGFLLFRLFDILKPLGIRKIESLPSGWGIMADDMAAGLLSLALLQVLLPLL